MDFCPVESENREVIVSRELGQHRNIMSGHMIELILHCLDYLMRAVVYEEENFLVLFLYEKAVYKAMQHFY